MDYLTLLQKRKMYMVFMAAMEIIYYVLEFIVLTTRLFWPHYLRH